MANPIRRAVFFLAALICPLFLFAQGVGVLKMPSGSKGESFIGEYQCGLTTSDACEYNGIFVCPNIPPPTYHLGFGRCVLDVEKFMIESAPFRPGKIVPPGVEFTQLIPIDPANPEDIYAMYDRDYGQYYLVGCQDPDERTLAFMLEAIRVPLAVEDEFFLPMRFNGYGIDEDGNTTPNYNLFFDFSGEILINRRKIVVVATPLDGGDEDRICFFDPTSDLVNDDFTDQICSEKLTLNDVQEDQWLSMTVAADEQGYTNPDTITGFEVKVFKENSRDIVVESVHVMPYYGVPQKTLDGSERNKAVVESPFVIYQGQQPSNTSTLSNLNTELPVFEENPNWYDALTFNLEFGRNENWVYEPHAEFLQSLVFEYEPNCLDELYDDVDLHGYVNSSDLPIRFEYEYLENLWDDITHQPYPLENIFVNEKRKLKVNVRYTEPEGEYVGDLLLFNFENHGSGYDFSFSRDADVNEASIEIDYANPQIVFIYIRTNSELDDEYGARFEIADDSNSYFEFHATTETPLEVSYKPLLGNGEFFPIALGEQIGLYHMADSPDTPKPETVDEFPIENTSPTGSIHLVELIDNFEDPNLTIDGDWTGGEHTLLPGETVSFTIKFLTAQGTEACHWVPIGNVEIDYRIGQNSEINTFMFSGVINPCYGFLNASNGWAGPDPPPPSAPDLGMFAFYLYTLPDGVSSLTGTFNLSMDDPILPVDLHLDIDIDGSDAFSSSHSHVWLKFGDPITEVDVSFTPPESDFGRHDAVISFVESAKNLSWSYDLAGLTCGGIELEPCNGGSCASFLQLCSADPSGYQRCQYCCPDGDENERCGFQENGWPCSMDPASGDTFDADCICSGTNQKWQSDLHNQPPHVVIEDQPDPTVCLSNNWCLHTSGASAGLGQVDSTTWICGTETVDNRSQGVWYLCETTRLSQAATVQNHTCQHYDGSPAWVGSCPGTAYKWVSNEHGDTPTRPYGQPDPANCLSTTDCLHFNGESAGIGTLDGESWICGESTLQGRTQGAWFQCEQTRATAGASIEDHDCLLHSGSYEWIDDCPGTEYKWRSDVHGQPPYKPADQPSPRVCLDNARCLHTGGNSNQPGMVSGGNWICDDMIVEGDNQGVWLLCDQSRAIPGISVYGNSCYLHEGTYEWLMDCPGTEYKWQTDYLGQPPYISSNQPNPRRCLDTYHCLHTNGTSIPIGVVQDESWICDDYILGGDMQGVWVQCDATRANAGVEMGDKTCVQDGSSYVWQSGGGSS